MDAHKNYPNVYIYSCAYTVSGSISLFIIQIGTSSVIIPARPYSCQEQITIIIGIKILNNLIMKKISIIDWCFDNARY